MGGYTHCACSSQRTDRSGPGASCHPPKVNTTATTRAELDEYTAWSWHAQGYCMAWPPLPMARPYRNEESWPAPLAWRAGGSTSFGNEVAHCAEAYPATPCFRTFGFFFRIIVFPVSIQSRVWFVAVCGLQEGSVWVAKCWCGCNSMCSVVLGCLLACWTPFCSH